MPATRFALAAAASRLALAACQYMPWSKAEAPAAAPPESAIPVEVTVEEKPVTPEVTPTPETAACDVLQSRDWAAWVNKMPGPDMAPKIHVTGKVDVRSGGYTFAWEEGPLDRSATPALRLKLVPKAPDGMATMAISTEEVKYEAPALGTGYRSVIISCGGTTLAEIAEIMDVY
jgi:hypothetical protein